MVARTVVFAGQFVNHAGRDGVFQRMAYQNMVNPQAFVFPKTKVAVIPPAIALGGLLEKAV
jgi:hypothetical protein